MKNKSVLALIEQAIMLLVFALAAVLCLRAFVRADETSRAVSMRDRALVEVQSAAEAIKASNGDFQAAAELYGGEIIDGKLVVWFDDAWEQTDGHARLTLVATPLPTDTATLGTAEVRLTHDGTDLAALTVGWQEEVRHE